MKHAHISIKASLQGDETIQHVLDQLRALLPADRVQIDCNEYVEKSTESMSQFVWLRDYVIDEPWERVDGGFDGNGGTELTEAASDFITQVGIVQALYGIYPETDEFGMPEWAEPDDENSSYAKITVSDYGFAVADQDFEVAGKCSHDDSGGAMWLKVHLSEEDYLKFEELQNLDAESAPAVSVAQ